jgi:hypothetical protein
MARKYRSHGVIMNRTRHEDSAMLRKVTVNTELVEQAVRLGEHKTKEEAATKALEFYIGCLKKQQNTSSFEALDLSRDDYGA